MGSLLRFLTAGESHGPALVGIIEGFPAGIEVDFAGIQLDLLRRQIGYGRGPRMKIEKDSVEFLAGIRHGITLGSPIALLIRNRDWENWQDIMSPELPSEGKAIKDRGLYRPRPGHGDLAGGLKYDHEDLRNVLERASARETAMRVAIGALAKNLLHYFSIQVRGFVRGLGTISLPSDSVVSWEMIQELDLMDPLPCINAELREKMINTIEQAQDSGETLGGVVEIHAAGIPAGLGSHVHWDRRLDTRICGMMAGIPAVKGVHIGLGPLMASLTGSQAHDGIFYEKQRGFYRETNRAGGLEAGISNGENIIVQIYVKPLPTLRHGLRSVDIRTLTPCRASYERSDITAVVPMVVIGESILAWTLADAFMEKFGGDHIQDTITSYESYCKRLKTWPQ